MTPDDEAVLAFAALWWRSPGAREQAIRQQFGFSEIRYSQWLFTLLHNPDAEAANPVLIHRLRRIASRRSAA